MKKMYILFTWQIMVLIICHTFFAEALHVFPIYFVASVYFGNE